MNVESRFSFIIIDESCRNQLCVPILLIGSQLQHLPCDAVQCSEGTLDAFKH